MIKLCITDVEKELGEKFPTFERDYFATMLSGSKYTLPFSVKDRPAFLSLLPGVCGLLSMQESDEEVCKEIVDEVSIFIDHQPFVRYVEVNEDFEDLRLLTYEWDCKNPESRLEELTKDNTRYLELKILIPNEPIGIDLNSEING